MKGEGRPGDASRRDGSGVQSLARAFELIEALQERGHARLEELAQLHGVHKTTTLRLLQTMEQFGYVTRGRDRGEFRLGLRFRQLGDRVSDGLAYLDVARTVMRELAEATGETIDLAVYESGAMILVESIAGRPLGRVGAKVGQRVPATCTTTGKLHLAAMATPQVNRILARQGLARWGPNSITDRDRFLRELDLVRALGYAINDEETDEGTRFVGVVIDIPHLAECAALILGAPKERLPASDFSFVAEMLRDASEKIASSVA